MKELFKNKKILVALLVLLAVVAFFVIKGAIDANKPDAATTAPAGPTLDDVNPRSPTPEPTEAPTDTPAPTATPAPTEVPVTEPPAEETPVHGSSDERNRPRGRR